MKVTGCGKGKVLTPEETKEIKQHIHFKYQVFFGIMWNTGARVSEVCKLRFVDVVNGTLIIRKGNTKGKPKGKKCKHIGKDRSRSQSHDDHRSQFRYLFSIISQKK